MPKHILNDVISTDTNEPIEVKRDKEIFMIDPLQITVVKDWNARTVFTGIDELMDSIEAVGVQEAMTVYKTPDKKLELTDGERRYRAVTRLRDERGISIKVPVIVESSKTNQVDRYAKSLTKNTGVPLNAVDQANGMKQLLDWGESVKDIAAKTCCSESQVRNRLELANATPAVKQAVIDKEITAGQAREIVKTSGGKVADEAHALLDKQTEPRPPRQKITRIFVESGEVKSKSGTCEPLQTILSGQHLRASIIAAGFDPDSIKLSITKTPDDIYRSQDV